MLYKLNALTKTLSLVKLTHVQRSDKNHTHSAREFSMHLTEGERISQRIPAFCAISFPSHWRFQSSIFRRSHQSVRSVHQVLQHKCTSTISCECHSTHNLLYLPTIYLATDWIDWHVMAKFGWERVFVVVADDTHSIQGRVRLPIRLGAAEWLHCLLFSSSSCQSFKSSVCCSASSVSSQSYPTVWL